MAIESIDSLDDPRLADYRDLQDADSSARRGLFVAETRAVVARLLASRRFGVRSMLVTPPALAALSDVLATAPTRFPVYVVQPDTIKGVVGFDFHRGCLALGERGATLALDAMLATLPDPPCLVALERVSNPDNVGGVFRNAMAFGVDAVLLSPGCADPLYRKAIRVSVGTTMELPFSCASDWGAALHRLYDLGFRLVALTTQGGVDIRSVGRHGRAWPTVLVLGNESAGLAPETLALVDRRVSIPMAAGVDSLNVATAAAIALHHLGPLA